MDVQFVRVVGPKRQGNVIYEQFRVRVDGNEAGLIEKETPVSAGRVVVMMGESFDDERQEFSDLMEAEAFVRGYLVRQQELF